MIFLSKLSIASSRISRRNVRDRTEHRRPACAPSNQPARPATSLRAQQKEAAWNNAYMLQLLAG